MTKKVIALPAPVLESDLGYHAKAKYALSKDYSYITFEMHYTERFGWCIPTLLIRKASDRAASNGRADRSYAISIKEKQLVRIGLGPHILRTVKVYVKESRLKALQPLLDIMEEGAVRANDARDYRSSRMLAGQERNRRRRTGFGGLFY